MQPWTEELPAIILRVLDTKSRVGTKKQTARAAAADRRISGNHTATSGALFGKRQLVV